MALAHGFVKLPPDGAGKQVPQSVMVEIGYDTGTTAFTVGDIVTFSATTSITGTVIAVNVVTGTTGDLHVRIDEPVPASFTFTVGENIIVNALTYAKIATVSDPYYFQQMVLTGKNMANQLEINKEGAAKVTFDAGSPQFDAFGKLQATEAHKIADYVMAYDELPNDFTTEIVNSGGTTLVYNHDVRGVTITTGLTSGDKVVRTSDEYHVYQPGVSQLIYFTGSMGDTGKANVIRRAGYYDDDNGVYFEFKELVLCVGLRSKSTGSVVDTFILQTEWNVDRLDGSLGTFNPSLRSANPLEDNLYWMDLQWLGAGLVRFGLIIDGVRVVAHEIRNATSASYMSTGSLPFRYEQENVGTAASSSSMQVFCAAVFSEGAYNPMRQAFTDDSSASITTVNETAIVSMRSAQTFKTFNNRKTIYPRSFDVYNPATEPMLLTVRRGATATGGSWVAHGDTSSTAEFNKTETGTSGGQIKFSAMIAPGETKNIPFPTFEEGRRGLRRRADITAWTEMMIGGQLVVAGTGGIMYVSFNWDEVSD